MKSRARRQRRWAGQRRSPWRRRRALCARRCGGWKACARGPMRRAPLSGLLRARRWWICFPRTDGYVAHGCSSFFDVRCTFCFVSEGQCRPSRRSLPSLSLSLYCCHTISMGIYSPSPQGTIETTCIIFGWLAPGHSAAPPPARGMTTLRAPLLRYSSPPV
jgi:hypothetical protein